MPVLIEGLSVVIRRDSVNRLYAGGLPRLEAVAPYLAAAGDTFCADDNLVALAFMAPADVRWWCGELEAASGGALVVGDEVAVVDMATARTTLPCTWLELVHYREGTGDVLAARLVGDASDELVVPEGWSWETSMTKNCIFVPNSAAGTNLTRLEQRDGLESYRDELTGEVHHLSRPTG